MTSVKSIFTYSPKLLVYRDIILTLTELTEKYSPCQDQKEDTFRVIKSTAVSNVTGDTEEKCA